MVCWRASYQLSLKRGSRGIISRREITLTQTGSRVKAQSLSCCFLFWAGGAPGFIAPGPDSGQPPPSASRPPSPLPLLPLLPHLPGRQSPPAQPRLAPGPPVPRTRSPHSAAGPDPHTHSDLAPRVQSHRAPLQGGRGRGTGQSQPQPGAGGQGRRREEHRPEVQPHRQLRLLSQAVQSPVPAAAAAGRDGDGDAGPPARQDAVVAQGADRVIHGLGGQFVRTAHSTQQGGLKGFDQEASAARCLYCHDQEPFLSLGKRDLVHFWGMAKSWARRPLPVCAWTVERFAACCVGGGRVLGPVVWCQPLTGRTFSVQREVGLCTGYRAVAGIFAHLLTSALFPLHT